MASERSGLGEEVERAFHASGHFTRAGNGRWDCLSLAQLGI